MFGLWIGFGLGFTFGFEFGFDFDLLPKKNIVQILTNRFKLEFIIFYVKESKKIERKYYPAQLLS